MGKGRGGGKDERYWRNGVCADGCMLFFGGNEYILNILKTIELYLSGKLCRLYLNKAIEKNVRLIELYVG